MGKFTILVVILTAIFMLACSGSGDGRDTIHAGMSAATPTPAQASRNQAFDESAAALRGPAGPGAAEGGFVTEQERFGFSDTDGSGAFATPAPAAAPPSPEDSGSPMSPLQTAQRMVISAAFISIEVEAAQAAVNEVRTIAESLGGFVEQLSSSGGSERQQATMTVRVPQGQFFTALERIEVLGEVQSRNLGSEDVSEQFIDMEARLRSAMREEQSLLALLERAQQVSEILTIERELSRVRSEIERLQGQLNFLERRVELATITISLFPPSEEFSQPPSASLLIEEADVTRRVNEIKNLAATLGGEVDQVFLSVREGRESADISLRVFPKDFPQAMESLESQGEVRSKELREGVSPVEGDTTQPEDPNARIDVSLIEKEPFAAGWVITIAAPIGGVLLAVVLGVLFYLTYRAGRNRRDRFV